VSHSFSFHFFDIENLVKFIKKLAKLVEFTLEKNKFPISFSKNSEILPVKKTLKGICFVREDLCSGLVWSGLVCRPALGCQQWYQYW